MTQFQEKVYNVVKKIPRGRVMTYLSVARAIAMPGAARAVGGALNKNTLSSVPCHRVVRSNGMVGGYRWGVKKKISLLAKEGVIIKNQIIDLTRCLWNHG